MLMFSGTFSTTTFLAQMMTTTTTTSVASSHDTVTVYASVFSRPFKQEILTNSFLDVFHACMILHLPTLN